MLDCYTKPCMGELGHLKRQIFNSWLSLVFLVFLVACMPAGVPNPTQQPLATPLPLEPTASPTLSYTPQSPTEPSSTQIATPTSPVYTPLCSPLEGEELSGLGRPELLKNPFDPPRPGDDGGHFGVDFAYWTRPDGSAMLGLPIFSVLDGQVAGVISDRFPYGNAILIETSLTQVNPAWLSSLPIDSYDISAPLNPPLRLTCPDYQFTASGHALSLYLLYAHMNEPASLKIGDRVSCGDQVGSVGTTGKSVNPHLHLETRIGPSGTTIASMAHYQNDASEDEMRAYCLWRLSGAFIPFDPMRLLSMQR